MQKENARQLKLTSGLVSLTCLLRNKNPKRKEKTKERRLPREEEAGDRALFRIRRCGDLAWGKAGRAALHLPFSAATKRGSPSNLAGSVTGVMEGESGIGGGPEGEEEGVKHRGLVGN